MKSYNKITSDNHCQASEGELIVTSFVQVLQLVIIYPSCFQKAIIVDVTVMQQLVVNQIGMSQAFK